MGLFFTVRQFQSVALVFGLCGLALALRAQGPSPPPPPPPHGPPGPRPPPPPNPLLGPPLGPHPGERLPELRRKFKLLRPVNEESREAMELSGYFLDRAEKAKKKNERFQADRYAAAADAQIHIADRQQYPGREPGPPSPPREMVARHLERAYFRLQQAGYFLSQCRDAHAKNLPQTGRRFYESAAQAYDNGDYLRAEADAKCVDDTVRTLEQLAQSSSSMPGPMPPPPPLPGPPPGPR